MRKLTAAINRTSDGFYDHKAIPADDELHQHYTDLLSHAGAILYGGNLSTYGILTSEP